MYLVNTRPNISFAINTLSQFMVESKRVHSTTIRHILKYVHGTIRIRLKYTRGDDVGLSGFTYVDWAGSSVDRKSNSGNCINIGSRMISWCSRKQKLIALSLAEAEYMAVSMAMCEAIWLRKLLVNFSGEKWERAIFTVIIRVA